MTRPVASGLLTDRYELTMIEAARAAGLADRRVVAEVFCRSLPAGRRFGVVAGTGRLLDALEDFCFAPSEIDWLIEEGAVGSDLGDWLSEWRFGGDIHGYGEGELFFPTSPILTVEASFADALLLETIVLSILNHDSAVASAAARMSLASRGRPLIEAGSRRTHEESAVAAARAAWIAGFASTSNLEAGRRHGVPTGGTTGHAFTLLFDDEVAAFEAQHSTFGAETTYLVDTYDIPTGVEHALAVAGSDLQSVRIDSGVLGAAAVAVRAQLDAAGATKVRIVASGDLDEHSIDSLRDAPIDAYLLGTSVVTGSGAPTVGLVYKLVEVGGPDGWRTVAKHSSDKATVGGRKVVRRRLVDGVLVAEDHGVDAGPSDVQIPLVEQGRRVNHDSGLVARDRCRRAMEQLGADARRLDPGPPMLVPSPPSTGDGASS